MSSTILKGHFKSHGKLITEVLGSGLYSRIESVIAEFVANAWDANASQVHITYPDKDFQTDPDATIVIKDNGEPFDWERLFSLSAETKVATGAVTRDIIGDKGIGRFAGFKIANNITFSYVENKKETFLEYDFKKIKSTPTLEELPLEVKERAHKSKEKIKQVQLSSLFTEHPFPTRETLTNFLLEEFGLTKEFKLFINGHEITEDDLKNNAKIHTLQHKSPIFGKVEGMIVVKKGGKGMKRDSGVIVRINNRRVDGPDHFNNNDLKTTVLKRMYGEVSVNDLSDLIHSGRESMLLSPKYQSFTEWLGGEISKIGNQIITDQKTDVYDLIVKIPQVAERLHALPAFQKEETKKILEYISPKLGRVRNEKSLLETIGLLVIRAIESNDFASVLRKLESTSNEDIAGLRRLLNHWGFKELVRNSQIVKDRLVMLNKFSQIISDDTSDELHDLHAILEKNPWIFEEKFSIFTSNRQLRTIAQQLQSNRTVTSQKRPDLILKTNSKDFLLVELKKPGLRVGVDEATQTLKYQNELKKMHPNMRDMDSYLIGHEFDEEALEIYPEGNSQRIHLLSLSELLSSAQERLNWLHTNLQEESEGLLSSNQSEFAAEEIGVTMQDLGM